MSKLIGFVGKKGSGKTECADYLLSMYNYKKLNFKDSLVAELKKNFPKLLAIIANQQACDIEYLFEKKPLIIRALLQNYGTEVRRNDHPDYWVNEWSEALAKIPEIISVAVDDVRFLNEAGAVVAEDGMLIRIDRPGPISNDTHASEIEMDKIEVSHVIVNDGNINNLYNKLNKLI